MTLNQIEVSVIFKIYSFDVPLYFNFTPQYLFLSSVWQIKKMKFLYALYSTLLEMHEVGGDPLVSFLTIRSWLSNLVNYYNTFANLKILVER